MKERIRDEKRREADRGRRKAREDNIGGRRGISPEGSGVALSARSRSSRAPSSTSTMDDVSDNILGDPEELPAEEKESPKEVSPETFPRASVASASGSRGRGRPPTTGEYVGYSKAQSAASDAKRRALDLEAEEEVARTGLMAKYRLDKASQKEKKKRAGEGTTEALLASQGDEVDMASKSVGALRADANFVAEAVLKVATTSGNLKGT